MFSSHLDDETADRMIRGAVNAMDAPPGFGGVVRLLDELSADDDRPTPKPLLIAEMAACIRAGRPVRTPRFARRRGVLLVALTAGAAIATTGAAFAGQLPPSAQDMAHAVLTNVGISVPGHATDQPGESAGNENDGGSEDTGATSTHPHPDNHGAEVRAIAHSTELHGRDKGIAVSTVASGGKSHAGDHPASGEHGKGAEHGGRGGNGHGADHGASRGTGNHGGSSSDAPGQGGTSPSQDPDHSSRGTGKPSSPPGKSHS